MKRITATLVSLLALCACVAQPTAHDGAGNGNQSTPDKNMEKLKANIIKAEEDIKRYDEQIISMGTQIAEMEEQFGEDDPVVAELRNALEEAKAARRERSKELESMKEKLAERTG